ALSESHSDARLMQQATLIPALVWAALWGVCGLAVIALTVRRTWAPRPPAR
ncbi:MAG: M50 family peptidase, partial [Alphaproteobacteria bacterium]